MTELPPTVINNTPSSIEAKHNKNPLITDKKDVLVEQFAGLLMIGAENVRDIVDNPEVYALTSGQVSTRPENSWIFSHIGNVFETTVLFSLTRLSFTAIDFAVKKVSKNKVGVPDEASFWASMAVGVLIPSLIELNQTLPIHLLPSYKGDPEDLFGIGVAAVVLIGSHYSRNILEKIKTLRDKKTQTKQTI